MLIYIVRHGETDWNKEHKVQGAVDIPLNKYGIHLAEETADGLENTSITIWIRSSLPHLQGQKKNSTVRSDGP